MSQPSGVLGPGYAAPATGPGSTTPAPPTTLGALPLAAPAPTTNGTAPATPASAPALPTPDRWAARASTWPLSVVAMAVAVAVGVGKVVSTYGQAYYHYGDQAVLALRVIDATHLVGQLGPYSRFGWSHPGPALFYLLAPWYSLSGGDPRSLLAGSLLINGGCLVAAVAVVRRFAGEWSARWSVAVLGAAVLALGIDFFQTFWNPDLEAPAVLLVMVLAAAAVAGSGPSAVWAAVVGSYAAQTDVGTAGLVGALVLGAGLGWSVQTVARLRRARAAVAAGGPPPPRRLPPGPSVLVMPGAADRSARRRGRSLVLGLVGAAVLALLWVPPVDQQLHGHPGNLSAIVDFFTTRPRATVGTTHTFAQAWSTVANATTALPWGRPGGTVPMTHAAFDRETTVVVFAALALVAVAWAAWRRRWFELGLGLATLGGLVVAVDSALRIVGPVDNYLVYWMALLPVPALVAVGSLVVDQLGRRSTRTGAHAPTASPAAWRTATSWVLAGVLVLPALVVARQWAPGTAAVGSSGDPEIGQLVAYATTHLRATPGGDVHVVIANADRWPEAAGLVLELTRLGYHPTVDPAWRFMFTSRRVGPAAGRPQLVLSDPVPGTAAAGSASFGEGDVPTTIAWVPAPTTAAPG